MIKKVAFCFYYALIRMIQHDGIEHSGYMSFMVLLTIFPFLVFLLAFTSFLGASDLGKNFITLFLTNMPELATEAIKVRISELSKTPPQSLMTLAICGSVWTASSFVECLRTILNRVYEIKSPPNYIIRRLLSIIQFIIISMFIAAAMFLLVIVPIVFSKLESLAEILTQYHYSFNIMRYVMIFISLFFAVSTLYYIVPNISLKFSHVAPGAFLTVVLWILTGYLLSAYLRYYNQLSIIYGSLGSIIITLIFFYIINILFIYGAEFNFLLNKGIDDKINKEYSYF